MARINSATVIDRLPFLGPIFFWLLPSLFTLIFFSSDTFQRLGSLGVALSIFLIGFQLRRLSGISDDFQKAELIIIAGKLERSIQDVRLRVIRIEESQVDDEELERASRLGNIVEHDLNALDSDKEVSIAKVFLKKREGRLFWFELTIVVLATLQWGYGDLFHCWINGKGWTSC